MPAAMSRHIGMRRDHSMPPCLAPSRTSRRAPIVINSDTMNGPPSGVLPAPKNVTMLGCRSEAITVASECIVSESSRKEVNLSSSNTLMATSFPCHVPRYTEPKPPTPTMSPRLTADHEIFHAASYSSNIVFLVSSSRFLYSRVLRSECTRWRYLYRTTPSTAAKKNNSDKTSAAVCKGVNLFFPRGTFFTQLPRPALTKAPPRHWAGLFWTA
mmetsp:Transcript_2423/g.7365  ORF Transcript_2423/g.7365 Transcript_2423/m.7365 type:complete len:213 (-) Transcript_2423:1593-2231(-)